MAFRIVWSATGIEDLKEIVRYVAMDNPEAAGHLAGRILIHIENASNLPRSNRTVPEKADEDIREAILKPYRIIYQVNDTRNSIHILRIWHASRGDPELQ